MNGDGATVAGRRSRGGAAEHMRWIVADIAVAEGGARRMKFVRHDPHLGSHPCGLAALERNPVEWPPEGRAG